MACANPHSMHLADVSAPLHIVDMRRVERPSVGDKLLRMLLGKAPSSGFALAQLDTVAGNAEFDRMARLHGRLA